MTMQSHWYAARLLLTAVWRRTRANPAATLALLGALVLPLTLGLTVPSYADAVGVRILNQELNAQSRITDRPALALMYRYVRANKAVAWNTILGADALVNQSAAQFLQFPIARITSHIRTVPLRAMLVTGSDKGTPLNPAPLATLVGIEELMKYASGRAPQFTSGDTEVAISLDTANTYGLNVADVLVLSTTDGRKNLRCTIVGIWSPREPESQTWLYPPSTLNTLVIVAPQSMREVVSTTFPDSVAQAAWYIQPQAFQLGPNDVWQIEQRIRELTQELAKVPAKLERSPLERFHTTQTTIQTLTLRTAAVAAPIALLALFFVVQLANIAYQRRLDEFILLRSRGVSLRWFVVVSAIEWLCYIVIATLISLPLSLLATQLMLRTDTFLHVTDVSVPWSSLPSQSFIGATIIGSIIVVLGVRPVIAIFRSTLSNNTRNRRTDRWRALMRILVEVVLVVAVSYGYYQLYTQYDPASDVFSNPLTLALPVVCTVTIGVIANRVLPWLLVLSEKIARRSDGLAAILALQTLARRPERLQTTVLLLTITLGIGGYMASMAATIDTASRNGLAYRIATDTQLIESAATLKPNTDTQGNRYLITPLGAHAKLPGVTAYAPIGNYQGRISIGSQNIDTNVVAIDRTRFLHVVPHFDDAWLGNNESLGQLMNQLALRRDGVIIDRRIAGNSNIGDRVAVTLFIEDSQVDVRMRIVAMVDGWPGQYSSDKPFLIANMGFVADEFGYLPPSDVWLRRDTTVSLDEILTAARAAAIPVIDTVDYAEAQLTEFTRPERQGLFGMLSIGFIAAAGLTIMAIVVSALATMRQRNIELGMLQAMGMPTQTARAVLIIEQSVTTLSGMLCGLVAAVVCATSILPSLHAGVAPHRDVPASTPITAWSTIAIMIVVYAGVILVTMRFLFVNNQRLRIADAVKLGDEN